MIKFSWYTFKEKDEYGRYVGNIVYGLGGVAPFRKCYEHYRPNMKGGHRHNHLSNHELRLMYRKKEIRQLRRLIRRYQRTMRRNEDSCRT